jgi:hypothetical protein
MNSETLPIIGIARADATVQGHGDVLERLGRWLYKRPRGKTGYLFRFILLLFACTPTDIPHGGSIPG